MSLLDYEKLKATPLQKGQCDYIIVPEFVRPEAFKEINADFRYAWWLTQVFYRVPHLAYRIFRRSATTQSSVTQMTDGVLIVDAQGRIQMTNPAAEKLFGEGETLIGKPISIALRHHQLIETWRKCQQSGEVQSDSVELPATRVHAAGDKLAELSIW